MKFGAEAVSNESKDEAEDEDWKLAQYFKLQLHPPELHAGDPVMKIEGMSFNRTRMALFETTLNYLLCNSALPYGVQVEQAYADLLHYLMAHTRNFFEARTPEGESVWRELIDSADIVLTHPNGWGLREQNVLRRAAMRADITSAANAKSRIHFVSEGEASVHFCIRHGSLSNKFRVGGSNNHRDPSYS